jgi:hypothetical protein
LFGKKRLDIGQLLKPARKFRLKLDAIKADCEPAPGLGWYPYDSLTNLNNLNRLLTGDNRRLLEKIEGPIADIGGADGDMAFFLESLGLESHIVDYAWTNYNHLKGAYKLKECLSSTVEVFETNLDEQFDLPEQSYGLVIFLGILYHLQNPFYALDKLAQSSKLCLLSTRVARFSPDGKTHFGDLPVAYLVSPTECNNDATNHWIFSPAGLRRLISRTGWRVLDWKSFGNRKRSDPANNEHDERVYALLESDLGEATA